MTPKWAVLALSTLAVIGATGCGSHSSGGKFAAVSEIPKSTPNWVVDQAHHMAVSSLKDPHPRRLRIRLGRVYVVELWGRFVCVACSRPLGGSSPRGTHATLKVNPRTRMEISFSLA
jgi:hypothetical protein